MSRNKAGENPSELKNLSFFQLVLWLGIFSFSFNLVNQSVGDGFTNTKILLFVFIAVVLFPPYLSLRNYSAPKVSFRFLVPLVVLISVCTPTVLQTDQFRYIWDGLVGALGVNPYKISPAEFSPLSDHFWVLNINHPEMHSVYPPLAQLHFLVATWLNPFFWNTYLGLDWMPALAVDADWKVEFGWKLVVGLLTSLLLYCFRRKRWDLILLHPLFLFMVLGNSHVDIIMITFLCLALLPREMKKIKLSLLLLSISILSKWLSVILLPGYLWHLRKVSGIKTSITSAFVVFGFISLFVSLYLSGADGYMFSSSKAFAENWFFFGYLHRFIADGLRLLGSENAINLSKMICGGVGILYGAWLSRWYVKRWITLRLYSLLIVLGFLVTFPTLHPWYLVVLIPLGVPYFKVLKTHTLWPFLAIFSEFFYIENTDPTVIRYSVYFAVSIAIFFDFRLVLKHVAKISQGNRLRSNVASAL